MAGPEYLTEDINDICFIDTETRALDDLHNEAWASIKTTSTGRYARSSKVIIVTYAIGDGEEQEWVLENFDKTLCWRDAPPDLARFMKKSRRGEGWFVAFNSAFDLAAMNFGMVRDSKGLVIDVEEMLDCAVRGAMSNMPPTLDASAKECGHEGKSDNGKLMPLFCFAEGLKGVRGTPQSHPEEWLAFREYAKTDIAAMRIVWKSTMDLTRSGWEEFWASERINMRGMPVDMAYVNAAADFAEAFSATVKEQVEEITGGDLYSVHQHAAIAKWCYDRVVEIPDGQDALVKRYDEETEGGEQTPTKLGCDRYRAQRLMALIERQNEEHGLSDDEAAVLDLLRVKEYGASATIGKFRKVANAALDNGRLPNQYVFNGAAGTGRYSSRGVQMHNLTRKVVKAEAAAIEAILDGVSLDKFKDAYGDVGMALSRMVRPMITAPKGRTLVWGDWSNIEARVLPWLACCEERLDVFRNVDADPSNPDVYVISAAGMNNLNVMDLWKRYKAKEKWAADRRQEGKVAELALGFGGGNGALMSMAANYGLAFTEVEASKIVADWRRANSWAKEYWDLVWAAFIGAMQNPGIPFPAGRVVYMGIADYFGGVSVVCHLPCGRPLVYRDVRWEKRNVTDKETGDVITKEQFTFSRGYGRVGIWYGILVENITQATAASILRRSLTELEYDMLPELHTLAELVGHTHDEMIAECDDTPEAIAAAKSAMHESMAYVTEWATGLPLAADMSDNFYYTKHED